VVGRHNLIQGLVAMVGECGGGGGCGLKCFPSFFVIMVLVLGDMVYK
jgi:hypothetical protein